MCTPGCKILVFLTISIFGIGFSSGCRKKKETIAIIYVRDSSNQLVIGAQVVLYCESSNGQASTINDTTETNSSGEAHFNYNDVYQLGQAGVAVLNIEAYKEGVTGNGIIKIEQETTSTETVFIQD